MHICARDGIFDWLCACTGARVSVTSRASKYHFKLKHELCSSIYLNFCAKHQTMGEKPPLRWHAHLLYCRQTHFRIRINCMDSQAFGFGAKAHRNPPTQSDNNDVVKAQDECGKGNKSTSNLSNEHRSKKHPFGVFAKKRETSTHQYT